MPLHLPRIVGLEIGALGVRCWVGVMAWLLLLRSRCVIAVRAGRVATSCCGTFVCWGTIVIVVGDRVFIRISFGGTPWIAFSDIVIFWCQDRSCLLIVMILCEVFLVSFSVSVEMCTPDLFFCCGVDILDQST